MRQTLKNNKQHTKKGDLKMKSEMNKTTEKKLVCTLSLSIKNKKKIEAELTELKEN